MCEVGTCERWNNGALLKEEGLNEGGEDAVGMGAGVGAVVEGSVSQDNVGTDGALGVVIMGWNAWDIEEREDLIFMLEQALG